MSGRRLLMIVWPILVCFSVMACSANNLPSQSQRVNVIKGDLIIKVNGTGKVAVEIDARPSFGNGGKVIQLNVREEDKVVKGETLAQLETDILVLALSQAKVAQSQAQVAVIQAKAAETQAENSLIAAQFNLDKTKTVSDIKDRINDIQLSINTTEVNQNLAQTKGDSNAVSALAQNMASYQKELENQQNQLAKLLSQDPYTSADAAVYINGQKYDRLTVEDIRMKELAVQSARQGIATVKQNIDLANRSLEQANNAEIVAEHQLKDATIVSPIDGIVITVNVKEGDLVPPPGVQFTNPIYIIDPSSIEVTAQIDEKDVPGVKPGQSVNINLDSSPGTTYAGNVKSIPTVPSANPQNTGTTVYDVKVAFVNSPPPVVKIGMSANVNIITDTRKNVLLVPNLALKEDKQGKPVVDVIVDRKVESRPVQIGLSDGINTEVNGGLESGDIVIINPGA